MDAAWEIARRDGLEAITLRDVAARVGMQAPSLYSHFPAKNAIYDAMFGQAWSDCLELVQQNAARLPKQPRKALLFMMETYTRYAAADLARYQLMNQRMVSGFEPSAESYAPAVEVLESFRRHLAAIGVTRSSDVDLCTAVVAGLIDQQLANDPGGNRWIAQLSRAADMLADEFGLPGPRLRRTK